MMFMPTFDDQDGVSEGEIQQRHAGPIYDPLFGDWGEAPAAEPVSHYDDLFTLGQSGSTETDEYAFTRYDPSAPPAPSFPDRFQPVYAAAPTELQRRLREETIVLPKERRWVVTVRELAE